MDAGGVVRLLTSDLDRERRSHTLLPVQVAFDMGPDQGRRSASALVSSPPAPAPAGSGRGGVLQLCPACWEIGTAGSGGGVPGCVRPDGRLVQLWPPLMECRLCAQICC